MEESLKFLVDDTLRGLSRKLRMIGFDCIDREKSAWWAVLARASRERRIVLTLSKCLQEPPDVTVWQLNAATANEQVMEVIARIPKGAAAPEPFRRCLVCNELLVGIPADDARKLAPSMVAKQHTVFSQCPNCLRLYWQGSHYHKMVSWMRRWRIAERLGLSSQEL